MFINLVKKESKNEQIYTSIGSTSQMRSFFWPELFRQTQPSTKNKTYYYYVCVLPRVPVVGLEDLPIVWWPNQFKAPDRIYPMTMELSFFEANTKIPFPKDFKELEMNHKPSHLTYIDMYEAGGGLRVSQYKWIDNDVFKFNEPLPLWTNKHSRLGVDLALYDNKFRPRWINPYHVQESNCFIRNHQNGWAGPVTSFWARLNSTNAFYS